MVGKIKDYQKNESTTIACFFAFSLPLAWVAGVLPLKYSSSIACYCNCSTLQYKDNDIKEKERKFLLESRIDISVG